MKALLVSLLLSSGVFAQTSGIIGQASTDRVPNTGAVSIQDATAGQLGPVIFTQTVYLVKDDATEQSTYWKQIGWSPSHTTAAANNSNKAIMPYNPDKLTATIALAPYNAGAGYGPGDSALLAAARFEITYDTTSAVEWNADSSNLFIADGNYNRADYGVWTYENIPKTLGTDVDDKKWNCALKVLKGAFIRFVFTGAADDGDDSTAVTLTLSAER